MPRFELSISPNYVPDWTPTDAIREIFQNALDQERENPENPMIWEYSKDDRTLIVSSKTSKLSKSSLLFGVTTKADKKDLIGVFGEGYKLALLVLTRLNKPVHILNYGEREVWIPSIEPSKKYGSEILVIRTKKHIFKAPPDNDLTFIMEEIDPDIFARLAQENLHIHKPKETIPTKYGRILLDDRLKNSIYINGLFVCKEQNFRYGYDVQPEHLTIGRDRKLVSSFDLRWITSKMWVGSGQPAIAAALVESGFPDVEYVESIGSRKGDIAMTLQAGFFGRYGSRAIPVSTQDEFDRIRRTYPGLRPIVVNANFRKIMEPYITDTLSRARMSQDDRAPCEILEDFYQRHNWGFNDKTKAEFQTLIRQSESWVWE